MYVYSGIGVRKPDEDRVHNLMTDPEDKSNRMTACGFIVWSDWRNTLRPIDCTECIRNASGR